MSYSSEHNESVIPHVLHLERLSQISYALIHTGQHSLQIWQELKPGRQGKRSKALLQKFVFLCLRLCCYKA